MKKRSRTSVRSRRRLRRSAPRATRPKSVLILQCNPEKLESQGFSFSSTLETWLGSFAPQAIVRRARGTTQAELLRQLSEFQQAQTCFEIIVVETHSDQSGLRLTADCRPSWAQFAAWLAPFAPRFVIVAGCQAGRWLPSEALFSGLPTLKEVYGSPVLTTEKQVVAFQFLVPHLLRTGGIKKDHRKLMQVAQFMLNGGLIFRHTRADFMRGASEGLLWTVGEELLRQVMGR